MTESEMTINQLIAGMVSEMKRMGYSDVTIWGEQIKRLGYFRKYYRSTGRTIYSPDVTEEYVQLQKKRYEAGEIGYDAFRIKQFTGRRMNEFFLTGTLRVSTPKAGTRYLLTEGNEKLIDQFLEFKKYGDNTRDDVVWVIRRYLHHWEGLGHDSMQTVTVEDVREFILKTAAQVKVSSLHNILLYLKYFHIFLRETGVAAPDCVELLSYKVYRDMPIQSYVTDEELNRILDVIDTSTDVGKRNKAIILVAATTGLRAIDIIRMKLSDIDWRKGEIKIHQAKTDRTIHVPLTKETGEALQDYILNARNCTTGCPEVFLRAVAPKTAIMDTTCIGCMFRSYQDAAGISRLPFDGKGFHGLRRRLAKKLLVNGTPLTTIAQILGHEDMKSARQYLSLNTDNLRECALGFNGIPVERRTLL